jgi:hypothetical protein
MLSGLSHVVPRVSALLLAALLVAQVAGGAQEQVPAALKAAFLYNFAKFTEWPAESDLAGPITLCVLDDRGAEEALAALVKGASINGRPVTVTRTVARDRLRFCHLLYIGAEDAAAVDAIVGELKGMPVLTVSAGERFARHGGIVGLLLEGNKIRFAINPETAQRSGVRLSSRLLSLATIIHD